MFLEFGLFTTHSFTNFVLGALCPVLFEALENNSDDEILIIVPDFNATTLRDFILLTYGLLSPENVDQFSKTAILELCQTLGMCSKDIETATMSNLEEENNVLGPDHVILTGRQMMNLVLIFEYFVLLSFLTVAEF